MLISEREGEKTCLCVVRGVMQWRQTLYQLHCVCHVVGAERWSVPKVIGLSVKDSQQPLLLMHVNVSDRLPTWAHSDKISGQRAAEWSMANMTSSCSSAAQQQCLCGLIHCYMT